MLQKNKLTVLLCMCNQLQWCVKFLFEWAACFYFSIISFCICIYCTLKKFCFVKLITIKVC